MIRTRVDITSPPSIGLELLALLNARLPGQRQMPSSLLATWGCGDRTTRVHSPGLPPQRPLTKHNPLFPSLPHGVHTPSPPAASNNRQQKCSECPGWGIKEKEGLSTTAVCWSALDWRGGGGGRQSFVQPGGAGVIRHHTGSQIDSIIILTWKL